MGPDRWLLRVLARELVHPQGGRRVALHARWQAVLLPDVRRPPPPGPIQPLRPLRLQQVRLRREEGQGPPHRGQQRPPCDDRPHGLPVRVQGPWLRAGADGPRPPVRRRRHGAVRRQFPPLLSCFRFDWWGWVALGGWGFLGG